MDTRKLLATGARGLHLLFDAGVIAEAFEQDADRVQEVIERDIDSIQRAVRQLLEMPDATQGRSFIARLPRELQHVIVLLYFELIDGQLRRHPVTLH